MEVYSQQLVSLWPNISAYVSNRNYPYYNSFIVTSSFFFKVFQECDSNEQERLVRLYTLLFVGFGIISLLAMFLQVSIQLFCTVNIYLICFVIHRIFYLHGLVKLSLKDYVQKHLVHFFDKKSLTLINQQIIQEDYVHVWQRTHQ